MSRFSYKPNEFDLWMGFRTVKVEGKTIDVPLSPDAAADGLDGLAKEIYCRVFDWLVRKINDSTRCATGAVKGTIDLLVSFLCLCSLCPG